MELGPPGRILWLDDLSNRLEAQDGKGSQKEHSDRGEQKGPALCCEIRRMLSERFATAARLYSEAVVAFTSSRTVPQDEYNRLRKAVEDAQERAEVTQVAYEEHVESHRCQEAQKSKAQRV